MVPVAFAILIALPWTQPPEPLPDGVQLVLTQPDYPFPVPEQLVIDIDSPRELPFNARTTNEKISTRPLPSGAPVTADGLAALQLSGSGQFCQNQFWALQETLTPDRQVTVVDLRAEPHALINNMAVSWGPPEQLPAEPPPNSNAAGSPPPPPPVEPTSPLSPSTATSTPRPGNPSTSASTSARPARKRTSSAASPGVTAGSPSPTSAPHPTPSSTPSSTSSKPAPRPPGSTSTAIPASVAPPPS